MASSLGKSFDAFQPEAPYKAFSGANIYATIGSRRVAALQALTVSITREVAALYSFSDANAKAFVKGKRGIAGTLVFTQFDRHALLEGVFQGVNTRTLKENAGFFSSRFTEGNPNGLLNSSLIPTSNFDFQVAGGIRSQQPFGQLGPDIESELKSVYDLVANQRLQYSDQIPPFDITITMFNEEGDAAVAEIGGVILVNEGWGYTIDDMVSEVAFTYVARHITPLRPITNTSTWTQTAMSANPRGTG